MTPEQAEAYIRAAGENLADGRINSEQYREIVRACDPVLYEKILEGMAG